VTDGRQTDRATEKCAAIGEIARAIPANNNKNTLTANQKRVLITTVYKNVR